MVDVVFHIILFYNAATLNYCYNIFFSLLEHFYFEYNVALPLSPTRYVICCS